MRSVWPPDGSGFFDVRRHTPGAYGVQHRRQRADPGFQVRSNPENKTHRVLLAKCPKQAREHFELYLRPDGELCMYSMRGDVGLGLNADTAGGWLDVELRFRGMSAVLYSDGREIRAMHDAVTRDIVMGDLTLCALNDGGLPFDGEIRNLELQSWCPENL